MFSSVLGLAPQSYTNIIHIKMAQGQLVLDYIVNIARGVLVLDKETICIL